MEYNNFEINVNSFPKDIWIEISEYFWNDVKSFVNLIKTCKDLYALGKLEKIWEYFCKQNPNFGIIKAMKGFTEFDWVKIHVLFTKESLIEQSFYYDDYNRVYSYKMTLEKNGECFHKQGIREIGNNYYKDSKKSRILTNLNDDNFIHIMHTKLSILLLSTNGNIFEYILDPLNRNNRDSFKANIVEFPLQHNEKIKLLKDIIRGTLIVVETTLPTGKVYKLFVSVYPTCAMNYSGCEPKLKLRLKKRVINADISDDYCIITCLGSDGELEKREISNSILFNKSYY